MSSAGETSATPGAGQLGTGLSAARLMDESCYVGTSKVCFALSVLAVVSRSAGLAVWPCAAGEDGGDGHRHRHPPYATMMVFSECAIRARGQYLRAQRIRSAWPLNQGDP